MIPEYFLSCDWGTTNFRLRLVEGLEGAIVDEIKTADGVTRIAPDITEQREKYFAEYFARQAKALLEKHPAEVSGSVVSGMASSRLGWRELPYAELPQPLDGSALATASIDVPIPGASPLRVLLVSGIRSSENVMRGEEVELLGLVKQCPELRQAENATLIMPGTHSKHVRLSGGRIIDFETIMTGELFESLSSVPTLRNAIAGNTSFDETHPWFLRGVSAAAGDGFFKSLFKIRARNLIQGVPPGDGTAYLSGLLIGSELLQIHPASTARVYLAAGGKLAALYARAARELSMTSIVAIPESAVRRAAIDGQFQILRNQA